MIDACCLNASRYACRIERARRQEKKPRARRQKPRAQNRFTEREVQRICRAVHGLDEELRKRIKRVDLDPTTGRYSIVYGDATVEGASNSWDEVLKNAPDAKRPA
jgi:hypothetical protein